MIAAPKTTPDLAGTLLEGAYRLVRLIGRGGMGAVYEAVQLRLNKRVVVKLMSCDAASDRVSLERFHREAEITSKLGHPHLVNLIDFGTAESGQPYLVMEYLEGEDLDQRLQREIRLSLETAVRIVRQSASALEAAHAQEVVHRDLKPANIFLLQVPGEPEFVKVLDFGISKVKSSSARRLTGVQSVLGTPAYMSPEQALGKRDETDHRADQWALACIAWEMLCGQPPFMADDTNALFFQIIRTEPQSLLKHLPDLQPATEEVLRHALSKRHTDRYPSIREFARAFELAALGLATENTPPPECSSHIADLIASEVSSADSPGPPIGAEPLASASATGQAKVPVVQPTERIPRFKNAGRRLLPLSAAATLALIVAGILVLRSSGAVSKASLAPFPTMPRPSVVAWPSGPSSMPAPEPEQPATVAAELAAGSALPSARALSERAEKSKAARSTKSAKSFGHATGKTKPSSANAQTKHRLFKDL